MKTIAAIAIALLARCSLAATELHAPMVAYRDVTFATWSPTSTVTQVATTNNGAFSATGTWYYAIAPTNDLGAAAASAVSNVTVATGQLIKVQWRLVAGASGYRVYRGPQATNLNEYVTTGVVTQHLDYGTNTWVSGSPAATATGLPTLVLARPGSAANDAVTKAQLDAIVAPTGAVVVLSSTDGSVALSGPATNTDLSITSYVASAVAPALSAATNAQAQAAAAAAAALTNGGVTFNGVAISNGSVLTASMAGSLSNGSVTVDGQLLTNGSAITTTGASALSTNGGVLAGAVKSTGRISITNAGFGTGFYVHSATPGEGSYLGSLSIGQSLTLWKSATANVVLALSPNAGAYGKLARYNGAGTYFDLVDSSTFTPSAYLSMTNYQAAITNVLRFMTTSAAPTNSTAPGNRGEVRTDATNLYICDGVNWGRFPGNWGPW